MTASNTFGRAVVWALTNKSGGSVAAGDVVIVDTSNNDAFTTTTSSATTALIGIATGTIASNAVGLILLQGYASLVNVNASVTRGHYGVTHTVAKQATDGGATRGAGTFCQFLTGGTTPDALLFNPDLSGAALTNPMTAKGQLIQGDTGGTPVALAVGTAGQALLSGGAGAFNTWGSALQHSTLGTTSAGGSFQTTRGTYMKKITLASAGFIANIVCFIKGDGATRLGYHGVLFSDSAGAPVNIIGVTGPSSVQAANVTSTAIFNTTVRALTQPLGFWAAAGDYWIGINQNLTTAGLAFTAATGSDLFQAANTDADRDISVTGTSGSTTDDNSIYADILR